MSKTRSLLDGAIWNYGAQMGTVVIQFAYAAITSRVIGPVGFGEYGIALTIGAFVGLLANGGLGQAAGRMIDISPDRTRALAAFGVFLGLAGALALALTAGLWAVVWQSPGATSPIRLMSLMALTGPLFGLVTGLMRRQGSFKRLAIIVFSSNVIGMICGAIAVSIWKTSSSLLVSPIVAQFLVVTTGFILYTALLVGRWNRGSARGDLIFSGKLTAARLLSYVSGNAGKYGVTVSLGASVLGVWNRTDVLTSVPFNQFQTAMVQAVYPEFRHDIASPSRAYKVWPDLLGLIAWVALPVGAVVAVAVPPLVPLLFGPGWDAVSLLVPVIAMSAAIQMVVVMLGSAIEALGRFRWIWATQITLVVVQVSAAGLTVLLHDWTPVLVALFVSFGVQHVLHVTLSARAGYLDVRSLLRHYFTASCASLVAATLTYGVLALLKSTPIYWGLPIAIFIVAMTTAGLWKFRFLLTPFQIARRYGLLK